MVYSIVTVLHQLRFILKEYSIKKDQKRVVLPKRIESLLESIRFTTQSSEQLLTSILSSPTIFLKLKSYLVHRLMQTMNQAQFDAHYAEQASKPREGYRISNTSLNSLVKDIFENIKSILVELDQLNVNLESCQHSNLMNVEGRNQDEELNLGCLLRMLMERSELELEKTIDQMLFRIVLCLLFSSFSKNLLDLYSIKLTMYWEYCQKKQKKNNSLNNPKLHRSKPKDQPFLNPSSFIKAINEKNKRKTRKRKKRRSCCHPG